MSAILLNDILKLENLDNVKIRFIIKSGGSMGFDPLQKYHCDKQSIIEDLFHKQEKQGKPFDKDQIAIGFMQLGWHKWLLFYVGKVKNESYPYEHELIKEYEKYFGRLIVEYHNKAHQLVRKADGLIQELKVFTIRQEVFEETFPGYENVSINWHHLASIQNNDSWRTALQNQKGIYLITDRSNGKMYVGSATGRNMLWGRWTAYIENGHGGNIGLKEVVDKEGFDYVKQNFKYTILETFQSKTHEFDILQREAWWIRVLNTVEFGHNKNSNNRKSNMKISRNYPKEEI
jgi:hypothetical protein